MKKKLLGVLLICTLLILTISLVMAIHNPRHSPNNNPHNPHNSNSSNESNSSDSNISKFNYGLCVSNYTKIKNNCFNETREVRKVCKNNVLEFIHNYNNSTLNESNSSNETSNSSKKDLAKQIRLIFKECRDEYNTAVNKCKEDFKINKDSCKQYKCNEKKNETWVNSTCISG